MPTWEVWRALKKLELPSAKPRATLTHLSCSPNFPRASYLDERTLTHEPIVNRNDKRTHMESDGQSPHICVSYFRRLKGSKVFTELYTYINGNFFMESLCAAGWITYIKSSHYIKISR